MKLWKKPKLKADYLNSMHDAFLSTESGDCLVYYTGKSGWSGNREREDDRGAVFRAAFTISKKLGGALVSKPLGPVSDESRSWHYMIQRGAK